MYYTINDAAYWYELTGEGPTVVLLHGFTGSSATWEPFVENLAQEFQVLIVDLPGHGKTEMATGRSMETCCSDLFALFSMLELTDIRLIGYSMGGRTALSFAMLYPELVKSLVLESTSPGLATESERQARITRDEQLAEKIEQEGVVKFVDFWEDIPLFQTQKNLPVEVRQKIRNERLAQNKTGLAQSLRLMGTGAQMSWWDRLHDLSIPVLLLAGAKDDKFVKLNRRMEQLMENAHLVIAEQAGHAIHVEQADFFGKIVVEFLLTTSR